ncbi:sialin-like [Argiope bruennichi]|uniref:sialin-like n=1 Tax=Argiope bruennichi TaxID=94029 RepID=UPI0024949C4B|nr:sialin-like [Argiope bruennichi]
MLEMYAVPQMQQHQPDVIFQQDGAPPHWGMIVRDFLDKNFPDRWCGRKYSVVKSASHKGPSQDRLVQLRQHIAEPLLSEREFKRPILICKAKCAGVRYLFVVAGFLGMCLVYALRVNMSIAILGMLNNTAISIVTDTHNLTNEPMCALLNPPIHSSKLKLIEVKGVTFPAIYNLLSRWTAEEEKTLIEAVVISGINIGTVLGMPLAAKLTNSDWFGGWPSAFYVIGFIGCVWFVFWILCVTNSPSEHPCITSKELEYMKASQLSEHEPVPIPWLKILTFGPFWAASFAQFVGDWTFFLLLNNLPAFYSTILNFNIETNGFMSSFPYILQSAVGCLGGFISDEVIKNGLVTPIFARKLCNMLGCLGSIVGLVISSTAGCDITVQITSFGLTMTAGGLWYCSYMITYLDISPEYAGTLIGVASTLSGLTGFITPMIVGALTDTKPTFGQWRIIFAMTIVLLIASAIVYQLFATADKQNWEDEHHTQRTVSNCKLTTTRLATPHMTQCCFYNKHQDLAHSSIQQSLERHTTLALPWTDPIRR